MKLVGQFDSPYVRRVAISMRVLGIVFEHVPWSIGKDQQRVAALNPLGQVPTLVLDDGEVIVDSATILDHFDQLAGPRALVPSSGVARRRVLHLATMATGLADKARLQVTERVFRPPSARHEPYVERLRTQMLAAAAYLEQACRERAGHEWLVGDALSQADISLACGVTYAKESAGFAVEEYAALRERHSRIEALPVFREIYTAFDAPVVA
jgi:glutathione S-transferase